MNYKNVLSFVLCLLGVSTLWGQKNNSPYLFDEFQDATVYLKDGMHTKGKMNYDLVSEVFCFIDKNGDILNLAAPEGIAAIEIGKRIFYPEKRGGFEIISHTPAVYVQYKVKARAESPKGAYGGGTETSSVRSYSFLQSNSTTYTLARPDVKIVDRYNIYWVEKDGKKKQFKSFKQLLKLYPKQSQQLNEYIKAHNIDFNDPAMIVKLCAYADSL